MTRRNSWAKQAAVAGWTAVVLLCGIGAASADEARILARDLAAASANIAAEYPQFGNLTLCVGRGGFMEWKAALEAGPHYVHFYYASGERRPCRWSVNGRPLAGEVLGAVTGGFHPGHLRWQTYGPVDCVKGANTIRLSTTGYMPHLKGLAVSTRSTPPDAGAFGERPKLEDIGIALAELKKARAAVSHLAQTYPRDYPRGTTFLARIDALEAEWRRSAAGDASQTAARRAAQLAALRRESLVAASPLVSFDKIVFIRRYTFQSSHYYTDYIDGCERFGGNLCVLRLADGQVTELVPQLRGGIFGRFDLSFDGRRVVFDYKPRPEAGFRIWQVNIDGSGLRQLTFDPPEEQQNIARYSHGHMTQWAGRPLTYRHQTDDLHPCYLPDGGIALVSTRCRYGILCDGPDVFTTTLLYRMDCDGGNLRKLSDGPLSESTPSVANDGRILYTRWEYVDKGDVVVKCLWAMRPDGTHSVEIYGNDIDFPDSLIHGRAVPGRNNLFTAIGAPHMPLGVGTVLRIDTNRPIRTRLPMHYVTPEVDIRTETGYFHRRGGAWVQDNIGPLWADPYPLLESFFLVSHNPDRPYNHPSAYELALLDDFGNCVPLYRDAEFSCFLPMPLRSRPVPPAIPRGDQSQPGTTQDTTARSVASKPVGEPQATVFMSDVYRGLEGVPRGSIKYLRILETMPRPWSARRTWDGDERYQQHAVVSMNASLHAKRMHGIVPVEDDGSACFVVPADKNLFFQALDRDFMEVQRMRTFVNLRPGEVRSCVGCHTPRSQAPAHDKTSIAAWRVPSVPGPQPGDAAARRSIDYATDIQPILDRHCVRCHGPQRLDAKLDLSGELTELFCRSYESLLERGYLAIVRENDPKTGNVAPVPPYTIGSHASKLVALARREHEGARLSREEFVRLVTWVDSNGQYYGGYFGRRNLKYRGLGDFRPPPEVSP